MKVCKLLLLLLCFLFACSIIQANEIKMDQQQKISFIQSNVNTSTIFDNKIVKFAASSGGGLSQGAWLVVGGVMLSITGICGMIAGISMVYVNADGVHAFGFDDQTFRVEYWDKKLSTGWALWGIGIGITTLSSIIFVLGTALFIVGIISMFSGRHAQIFIESNPQIVNTSVGISIKL